MKGIPGTLIIALGACAAAACSSDGDTGTTPTSPDAVTELVAEPVVTTLASPVHLSSPAGDGRLFIVGLGGTIRVVVDGVLSPTPFLDISSKVSTGGERGLLSMAFDPQFAQNRRFYVDYTGTDGATRVERYVAPAADPSVADPSSASLVISVPQPYANHNGGHIVFGPDGMLYVAMGDGGGPDDPDDLGQSLSTLLGAILRLDVRGAAGYAVPADNPFTNTIGARPEVWAYGLRNPWRIAFDAPSGRLYVADVGENTMEEVNVESASAGGRNYGWSLMEGTRCNRTPPCDQAGLVLPKHTYDHTPSRCSITGGSVYRGAAMPSLRGHYFYADFCEDGVRSFRLNGGAVTDHRRWDIGALGRIVSFGTDAAGELYVVATGGVYRLRAAP